MKKFKQNLELLAIIFVLSSLTGCAAGAATAGYALKAKEADYLSAQGEQRITERVKREMKCEMEGKPSFPCHQESY